MVKSVSHSSNPSVLITMHELSVSRGEKAGGLLLQLQQLLEQQADPNEADKNGVTSLSLLRHVDRLADWKYMRSAIFLLMDHGANVWRDRSLSDTTTFEYLASATVVNDGRLSNVWGHLASALAEGVLKQEDRGVFTDNPSGNNALHVACKHGIELVPYLFQENFVRSTWATQKNLEGDTPLHCLWNKRETLTDLMRYNDNDRTIDALWQATADLIEHGADVLQVNAHGQTVLPLINQIIKKGLRTRGPAWPIVETLIQAAELGEVAPVAGKRKASSRL